MERPRFQSRARAGRSDANRATLPEKQISRRCNDKSHSSAPKGNEALNLHSNHVLEEVSERLRSQAGGFGDTTHRDCVDRIISGNNQACLAVRHDDVAALAGDVKAEFLKNAHGILLADSGNFRHSALDGDKFGRDFVLFLCGLVVEVFFRNCEPPLDGIADIGEGFFASFALAPTAGEGGAAHRIAFIGFYEQNSICHTVNG